MTSCNTLGNSKAIKDDMVCPAEGLDESVLPDLPDILPEQRAFKKQMAQYISEYRRGGLAHKILLECWKREAAKRNKL